MIWNCCDKSLDYEKKVFLMGIVNVTPDSFSDGGKWLDTDNALKHALCLEADGADILDVGGQSTRPGHTPLSAEEEWVRIEHLIKKLADSTELPISVDTYYPDVAKKALEAGACIVNDVSGVVSREMAKVVKEAGAGWIIMHSGAGEPTDVDLFFKQAIKNCESLGIDKSTVCFDMGIGFGKNYEQDLALIANVRLYKQKNYPLLLGCSRKRVIGKSSRQEDVEKRTFGNIAADTAAILAGVDIIRLHNINEEKQGILVAEALREAIIDR